MRYLLILFLAVSVSAQSANVLELAPTDTAKAKLAWDALQRAQVDWDRVYGELEDKYVDVKNDCSTMAVFEGRSVCRKKGFENGFEFSDNFRFIVPKRESK